MGRIRKFFKRFDIAVALYYLPLCSFFLIHDLGIQAAAVIAVVAMTSVLIYRSFSQVKSGTQSVGLFKRKTVAHAFANANNQALPLIPYLDRTASFLIRNATDQKIVLDQIKDLGSQSKNLVNVIEERLGETEVSLGAAFEKAKVGKESLEVLKTSLESVKLVEELIGSFVSALNDVFNSLSGIDDIAKSTKLLSFNAGIEASRLSSAGAIVQVLAKELSSLADQVGKFSRQVRLNLGNIETNSKEFKIRIDQTMANAKESVNKTSGDFIGIIDEVYVVNDRFQKIVEQMNIYKQCFTQYDEVLDKATRVSATIGAGAANVFLAKLLVIDSQRLNAEVQKEFEDFLNPAKHEEKSLESAFAPEPEQPPVEQQL